MYQKWIVKKENKSQDADDKMDKDLNASLELIVKRRWV